MNTINDLNQLSKVANSGIQSQNQKGIGDEFANLLKESIEDLNKTQETAEAAMTDIATGEVKDLHQAAIAISKAETSMKFMLEVRNKAISAYKEIKNTQV
ncbi:MULTISPECIES: flagellar hook-basal body complex protein FliE [unclassified Campylobacter]|uniref:flagellar hook-basal body complex protein FliE n=1 Tax=unclassified Campylobacter TaxID=2593542 RepID=UPI001237BA8E|nr:MULTISPECIES: flagellar hook-basal body complex protein FliE [unclassified Campylobacter]KAA6225522.1 flagellar hook-basal body complex protein FliE [Campylobacter sp. LR196d]KAA6226959.1 flagellar hook-basal body complex protein FliE [Campylobacter sp. LR185c]KAA6229793.1 flagellar hook-basal body complex protein FliE [Campylobacter sp. LR286c]KAA6234318.1 flagellar hook-basal body complex protein FliE [Campylobacter sp. LR291e]KAA6234537.1 flagellar hook-basal body complex protein FliE [C